MYFSHKLIALWVMALPCSGASADPETDTRSPKLDFLCVSLGHSCQPAVHLDRCKLRAKSFPFDWNITPLDAVCEMIENHFLDFLNPQFLERDYTTPLINTFIINRRYKTALAHDWPIAHEADGSYAPVSNYLDFLEEVATKYQRRIERFYNVCDMAKTVYFFRLRFATWLPLDTTPQTRAHIKKLRDILVKTFPSRNWVLVAIGSTAEYKQDWGMPNVRNFYIPNESEYYPETWDRIFRALNLKG